MKNRFYVTTPIYYANDKPHIGHAYTTVAADILARFHKLQNEEVFLSAGMDEHGLKIQKAAERAGKNPQEFVDGIAEIFKDLWKKLGIEYNGFVRTTDPKHKEVVQKVLQILKDKGAIYKGEYEGLYCTDCEQFKSENELVDGKCPDHNTVPEIMKEECYLLKMAGKQKELIEKIEKDEFKIAPEKHKNEVLSFLKNQTLRDVSISRKNVKWGVELPFDKEHTTYVWIDAFLNYLTGLGWKGDLNNIPTEWPADIQLIGKDILRVHATIWPIMLLHLGIPLPKLLFAHGYIQSAGKKMSKTIGNVINIEEMLEKFGTDGTRYLLLSAGTFGDDIDITMERLTEKYNADLANGLSNLIYRILNIMEKNYNGIVPNLSAEEIVKSGTGFKFLTTLYSGFSEDIEQYSSIFKDILNKKDYVNYLKLNKMLELICSNDFKKSQEGFFVQKLNRFIEDGKLWEVNLQDKKNNNSCIYSLLESFRLIAWLIMPFMPETSDKIFIQLGLDLKVELKKDFENAVKWGGLKSGKELGKKEILFKSIK